MLRRLAVASLCLVACDKPQPTRPGPASGGGAAPEPAVADGSEPGRSKPDPAPLGPRSDGRTPLVAATHPLLSRLEGDGFPNDCNRDRDCYASGCSSEVCSAEPEVMSDCAVVETHFPADASCGCVDNQCQWFSPSGAVASGGVSTTPPQPAGDDAPGGVLTRCAEATCKPGQDCVSYFGIAGAAGPKFESCEWTCALGKRCPKGMTCRTISDGPGPVCR